ncbi:unnamed protein product [Caenorhabditis sp. 36 PRJEB53466]|nr:unnamed protein product [Caenorhabditis sp. 36 PRJEB53466]
MTVHKKTAKKEKGTKVEKVKPKKAKSKDHKKDRKHKTQDGKVKRDKEKKPRIQEREAKKREKKEKKEEKLGAEKKKIREQKRPSSANPDIAPTVFIAKKAEKDEKIEKKWTPPEPEMKTAESALVTEIPSENSIKKQKSGSLKVEKTQKSEEEKAAGGGRQPNIEPQPPGAKQNPTSTTPNDRVKNLYKILEEVSNTHSTPPKEDSPPKEAAPSTPEAKTPETVGPPMWVKSPELEKTQSSDRQEVTAAPPDPLQKAVAQPDAKKKSIEMMEKKKKKMKKKDDSVDTVEAAKIPTAESPTKSAKSKPTRTALPLHSNPIVPIFAQEEHHFALQKVDFDMIARTGMYLERFGMSEQKKQAFDWIAYNRHNIHEEEKLFSANMSVALADIGVTKSLLIQTMMMLKNRGEMTSGELEKVLKCVNEGADDRVSMSKAASFLRKNCDKYRAKS